jgi:hypothetical protein
MQKFFIKAFTFVIGLSLIFNVLGTVADRVAPLEDWRAKHQQRADNLEARREKIEAITLGNSHSDALDYSVLGIEGQSLAFAAADLFEVEKYAALMADELPNLKTVFIAISYYSFSRDNATFEPFRTRRIRFYSLVPTWSPIRGDAYNFMLGRLESYTRVMSVVRSDDWQGVWSELSDDIPPENPFPFDGVVTTSAWGTCSHYTAEQLESHAWEIANRNVTSSSQMAAVHQGLGQDAFDALARTIERLQSKGIRVVLFNPTYYEKYTEHFTESGSYMIDDMQGKVEALQQTYQVENYDFSNDPEVRDQPELFYNSDHLGDCGHRVFSAKLLEAMNDRSSK